MNLDHRMADKIQDFAQAMNDEMVANEAHKGSRAYYLEATPTWHFYQISYHAAKLMLGQITTSAPFIREYAADIGNHAMLAAVASNAVPITEETDKDAPDPDYVAMVDCEVIREWCQELAERVYEYMTTAPEGEDETDSRSDPSGVEGDAPAETPTGSPERARFRCRRAQEAAGYEGSKEAES